MDGDQNAEVQAEVQEEQITAAEVAPAQQRDENAARKSRLDKRVAAAEKEAAEARQRVSEQDELINSLRTQMKVYESLPEDDVARADALAKGQAELTRLRAQVNEQAKQTLARSYATSLGVDEDVFMRFNNPKDMEAAYDLLLSQRDVRQPEPVEKVKETTPAEPEPDVKNSGYDTSGASSIFSKSVKDMSSDEFNELMAKAKRSALKR